MGEAPVVRCQWCAYNKFRCGSEDEKTCDFKTLPMEKEAILNRLREEMRTLMKVRAGFANGELTQAKTQELRDASDRAEGMQIMIAVLEEKFGVSKKELLALFESEGIKQPTFAEKVKLSVKLAQFKNSRASKQGNR